jgi:uncharacterized protein with GYD domain
MVRSVTEAFGGKLHSYWYAFGDADGYILVEGPDNVMAAAELAAVSASGAFRSISTTVLIPVEEMLESLAKAKTLGYRAPGSS